MFGDQREHINVEGLVRGWGLVRREFIGICGLVRGKTGNGIMSGVGEKKIVVLLC